MLYILSNQTGVKKRNFVARIVKYSSCSLRSILFLKDQLLKKNTMLTTQGMQQNSQKTTSLAIIQIGSIWSVFLPLVENK